MPGRPPRLSREKPTPASLKAAKGFFLDLMRAASDPAPPPQLVLVTTKAGESTPQESSDAPGKTRPATLYDLLRAATSAKDKRWLRETFLEVQGQVLRALLAGDRPPVLAAFARLGPRLLAADPLNPGPLLSALEDLWQTAEKGNAEARAFLEDMGKALAYVGKGRPSQRSPEERRAQTRTRKRRADARVRTATRALQDTINKAINMLPPADVRDPLRFRVARQKIHAKVLQDALKDTSPAVRKAARQLQAQYARQWSKAAW